MDEPLAETWLINHRATLLLIANLDEGALASTLSTRGGRSVGQQFVHVVDVRRSRLEAAGSPAADTLPALVRADGHDQAKLVHGLTASAYAVAELIVASAAQGGAVKGFTRGVTPLIGYLIAHEAHHRGHAMLTLRQCGVPLPDEVRFGIWDWDRL